MIIKISDEIIEQGKALDEIMDKFNRFEKSSDFVYVASSAVCTDVLYMWRTRKISDVECVLFLRAFCDFILNFNKLR